MEFESGRWRPLVCPSDTRVRENRPLTSGPLGGIVTPLGARLLGRIVIPPGRRGCPGSAQAECRGREQLTRLRLGQPPLCPGQRGRGARRGWSRSPGAASFPRSRLSSPRAWRLPAALARLQPPPRPSPAPSEPPDPAAGPGVAGAGGPRALLHGFA